MILCLLYSVICIAFFVQYNFCTSAQMPNDRANWSDMATKTLLDLCIEQKRLFNWNRLGPSPHGWQNIYPKFEQQTGLHYGHKQVQNKLGTLKRAYQTWKELQNSSGLGRDRNTGGVAADDTYWVPTQGVYASTISFVLHSIG